MSDERGGSPREWAAGRVDEVHRQIRPTLLLAAGFLLADAGK